MMISIKDLTELIIVILTIKLILARYKPPIQESVQAIICLIIGVALSIFLDPSKEGLMVGLIGSGFAFYGEELLQAFKKIKTLKSTEIKNAEEYVDKSKENK